MRRVDTLASVVQEETSEITRGVDVVVPIGVVRVVERSIHVAVELVTRVREIEVADLAFDSEADLVPLVLRVFVAEVLHGVVAGGEAAEVVAESANALLFLHLHDRGEGPVVVQLNPQRSARTGGVDGVVVVLDVGGVVDGEVISRRARIARVGAGAGDVIDPAGLLHLPAHQAHCSLLADGHVDEALGHIALATVVDGVAFQRIASREARSIRLVGDDADGARLRAGAVQRALRTGQRLDAGDVVQVDVQVALNGGDGLLVEVGAHARLRGGGLTVTAGDDAAHVDGSEARASEGRRRGRQAG